jgi:hypothetical protein
MEISLHVVKNAINIFVIFSTDYVKKSDYIFMAVQFLEEHYFTVCSLCIGSILECIENLF